VHHPVDQADPHRLASVDDVAGEDQLLGARHADRPRQEPGAAAVDR